MFVIHYSPLHADNFSTTAMTSIDADTPTTYSTESVETEVTTNNPTDYSLVSDGISLASRSNVVPTAVGVLSFLVVFIGLLVATAVTVLYLYRKRKNKKRRYINKLSLHCNVRAPTQG